MNKLKTFQGPVYPWFCDQMGHMNVQFYVSMFDQAGWNIFSHVGLTVHFFKDAGRGMAAVEQNIKYKKELIAGQNVTIESFITDVKDKVLIIQHAMFDTDTKVIAAECKLVAVHLDTINRKSVPFPDHVLEKAKALVTSEVL